MDEIKTINSGDRAALVNINDIACANRFYRQEIWTGEHLQVTVMSIPIGGEVGLEMHGENDQLISVEYGVAAIFMGDSKQGVRFVGNANSDYVLLVPAGTWHNVINAGSTPLKLFSVYAPPHHPKGTVHKTKFDSDLSDY